MKSSNRNLNRFLFTGLALFSLSAFAGPWEGPRLTEDQLREVDTFSSNSGRKDIQANSFANFSKFSFAFSYINAFNAQVKDTESPVNQASNSAGGMSNPVPVISAVNGLVNGIHSPGSNALFALSVGVDIISWLTSDRNGDDLATVQKQEAENYTHPSLWLVKIKTRGSGPIESDFETNDARIREEFRVGQERLLAWPLDCDQTYYRTTGGFFGGQVKMGDYIPGVAHSRRYSCGLDEANVSFGVASRSSILFVTAKTSDDTWVSRYSMPRLDANAGIKKMLGLAADRKDHVAFELYKKVLPTLDKDWYAVYTAPNESGVWRVYVAHNESAMEFDTPPKPKK